MSVTLTIDKNREYCWKNLPHLVECKVGECVCVDEDKPLPDADCIYCVGTGLMCTEEFPFEMNLANGNFATLWNDALRMPEESGGEIEPDMILEAIKRTPKSMALRKEESEGNFWSGGVSMGQATRYFATLEKIAREALSRGAKVIWC